ncbi:MAG: hypothetical protein GX915_01765 [Clostridiales bacterium]|nr:hypothetical protein [Clostridiales bacterium]
MRKLRYMTRKNESSIFWVIIIIILIMILIVIGFKSSGKEEFKKVLARNISYSILSKSSGLLSYETISDNSNMEVTFMTDRLSFRNIINIRSIRKALASESLDYVKEDYEYDTLIEQDVAAGIEFHSIINNTLTKDFILNNGSGINNYNSSNDKGKIHIDILEGHVIAKDNNVAFGDIYNESTETFTSNNGTRFTLKQLKDINFMVRNLYIVDATTKVTEPLFDAEIFASKDMTIKQGNDKPQILIYHTHSQEAFIDSRPNVTEDTIVGVGSILADILRKEYGYNVIHDKTEYDVVDGFEDRNKAYNYAKVGLENMLEKNPSIEVVIDLHRDDGAPRTVMINGKETAKIMLFNGLSRDQNGPLPNHDNPFVQDNLAFGFQLQLESFDLYPGFFMKNYLKCYRYNLHMRPKSLLVELGTVNNSLESAQNSMDPFAHLIDRILQGEATDH